MGRETDYLPNPFTAPAPADPRTVYQPMTARELAALSMAPKRTGPGTSVTVRSYDIPWLPGPAEHMYVEYDDGRDRLVARGGPSAFVDVFDGNLRVVGGVSPAGQSRDGDKGGRVLQRGFIPNRSADEAAAPARRHAEAVNKAGRQYGVGANSNSFAADVAADMFGVRPGDSLTPGYRRRLNSAPRARPSDVRPAVGRRSGL